MGLFKAVYFSFQTEPETFHQSVIIFLLKQAKAHSINRTQYNKNLCQEKYTIPKLSKEHLLHFIKKIEKDILKMYDFTKNSALKFYT